MNNNFIFRLIKETEKEEILKLYKSVQNEENCVWNEYYPTIDEINHDYETNNLFVLEEGKEIIAAISIVPENEMNEYEEWKHTNNTAEIARVVVRKDKRGKGLSLFMLDEVCRILIKRNIMYIHLAVAIKNPAAIKNYLKYGFEIICEKEMYDNIYYLCEKNIGVIDGKN